MADWASLLRKEDWLAVWLGFVLLAAVYFIKWVPRLSTWTVDVTKAFPAGSEHFVLMFLGLLCVSATGVALMKEDVKRFTAGFPAVFALAFLSFLMAAQKTLGKDYGLEFAIWALALGLLIGNTVGTPRWLLAAARTELFIKIGLVLLGAEVLFYKILVAGAYGLVLAGVAMVSVFYVCYFLATKLLKLDDRFAAVLSSGVSICGVSAAIAAGGAVRGDPKHVSYTISLVLLIAMPMLVLIPSAAKLMNLPDAVAGAWIGGTIDTTPAVVAAGALHGKVAMDVAIVVKMALNAFIGVCAFALAVYFTAKGGFKSHERPSVAEVWYRFPKFILGFMAASLIFSIALPPAVGTAAVEAMTKTSGAIRVWWFAMAFVSIGLTTRFIDLVKLGEGKPAVAFVLAQAFNVVLVLALAWMLFGGVLLPTS